MIDRTKKLQASFYATSGGREPVREWLLSLPAADRATIGKDIAKVEFGWPIGMPYCRSLGGGLWEVRSDVSDGRIARTCSALRRAEWFCCMASSRKRKRRRWQGWIWPRSE
jgi:hypothetical protein